MMYKTWIAIFPRLFSYNTWVRSGVLYGRYELLNILKHLKSAAPALRRKI
jgi:hypothetical protein